LPVRIVQTVCFAWRRKFIWQKWSLSRSLLIGCSEWLCVRKRCIFLLLGQLEFEKNGSMLPGKFMCQAIEQRTTVNSHPERFQANHEKLYESEKRTELIQTTAQARIGLLGWIDHSFSLLFYRTIKIVLFPLRACHIYLIFYRTIKYFSLLFFIVR
jgi:hypothetical protein